MPPFRADTLATSRFSGHAGEECSDSPTARGHDELCRSRIMPSSVDLPLISSPVAPFGMWPLSRHRRVMSVRVEVEEPDRPRSEVGHDRLLWWSPRRAGRDPTAHREPSDHCLDSLEYAPTSDASTRSGRWRPGARTAAASPGAVSRRQPPSNWGFESPLSHPSRARVARRAARRPGRISRGRAPIAHGGEVARTWCRRAARARRWRRPARCRGNPFARLRRVRGQSASTWGVR